MRSNTPLPPHFTASLRMQQPSADEGALASAASAARASAGAAIAAEAEPERTRASAPLMTAGAVGGAPTASAGAVRDQRSMPDPRRRAGGIFDYLATLRAADSFTDERLHPSLLESAHIPGMQRLPRFRRPLAPRPQRQDELAAPDVAARRDTPESTRAAWHSEMTVLPGLPRRRSSWRQRWDELEAGVEHPPGTPNPVAQFRAFVRGLDRTAEFQMGHHAELRQRVARLLDAMAEDAELRATCFAITENYRTSCGDGQTQALNDMELAVLSHRSTAGQLSPSDLLPIARQMQAVDALDAFARSIDRDNNPETVELVLALRVQLRARLALPVATSEMLYGEFAQRIGATAETVEQAQKHVDGILADRGQQIAYLAEWAPWTACLERRYPERFAQVAAAHAATKDQLQEQMAGLDERQESMTSAEYASQSKALLQAYDAAERDAGLGLRRQLTESILDALASSDGNGAAP